MKILIIDSTIDRDSWGEPNLRKMAALAPDAWVTLRRAPEGDLPADFTRFDRIILSGSKTRALDDAPWIDSLLELIRRSLDRGTPLLGVCFGHQMIARALGGRDCVRASATPEFGWSEIEWTENSPLSRGLPARWHSYSSHMDEVSRLPKGCNRLARSPRCEIQAFEVTGKPVFGVQFHPEKDLAGAERALAARKKSVRPEFILKAGHGANLFDPTASRKLFENFFEVNA